MAKVGRPPKLNDTEAIAVLRMLQKGVKGYEVALHFQVSPSLISGIKTGKRYIHVPRPMGGPVWLKD